MASQGRGAQGQGPTLDRGRPFAPRDAGPSAVYLSNDDTMSLSSAQRVIYAIEHFAPLPREHIRPHELLNYFSFKTSAVQSGHDFSVTANIDAHPEQPGTYTLGLAVQGRPLLKASRRNANLSFVIDRSGSMNSEGRMQYVKRGLLRAVDELKHGDIVHLALFDSTVCQLAQNFVVGRDQLGELRNLINRVTPRGSTNLHDGLLQGYETASVAYQPEYTNRVVIISDALTNTGTTDPRLIAMVSQNYDRRRIRLSAVGVGRDFNDALLDELSEKGHGAYVFLGSEAEVDAVFGQRFVSLIETIADDVHFRLHLPPSLSMKTFYGEEASVDKERVEAIHYFAGTGQMFLSDLEVTAGSQPQADDIMLTIEYSDPETGQARVEESSWSVARLFGRSKNLDKARLLQHFAQGLGSMAQRPLPPRYDSTPASWYDEPAAFDCRTVSTELSQMARAVSSDPEVGRVLGLWDTYCSRFHAGSSDVAAAHNQRNNDFAPPDRWPGASL